MDWYITNNNRNTRLKTNFKTDQNNKNYPAFYIDGYVLPRQKIFEKYCNLNQEDLIRTLYNQNKDNFIKDIKGIFIIIIFEEDSFKVFNDRQGIKKWFIYQNSNTFFISNSMEMISKQFPLSIDFDRIAVFSLTSHFINGLTSFRSVTASMPGQMLTFKEGEINSIYYWKPGFLLEKRNPIKRKSNYYSIAWANLVHSYIKYYKPKEIAVTITGGNDSRMVLAALLPFKDNLHGFTYGNPCSYDVHVAVLIRDRLNLKYSNYYVSNPTSSWFKCHAKQLVRYGNSLINIHRAHRNDALDQEKKYYPGTEMIYTGLMGGEYIKEPQYNVVIPGLFYKLRNTNERKALVLIKNLLIERGINLSEINLKKVYDYLQEFLNLGNGFNKKEQKFIYTYYFYGCAHHSQDSNIFLRHIKYLVNPFMDVDFLELIADHPDWYLNKFSNILHRLRHSEFLISITDRLAPELSYIPYAKRGQYTADELLRHKPQYFFKRVKYFFKKDLKNYPSNFPMGCWLNDFCIQEINNFSPIINKIFSKQFIEHQLAVLKDVKTEEYWHLVTNPINISMIYEHYRKI